MPASAALGLAGLLALLAGADLLTRGGVGLATRLGVPPTVVGLTVVAFGTSAPELATTLVATLRGQRELAVGNLLGSFVHDIAFVLGATVLVAASGVPVEAGLLRIDLPVMTLAALACAPAFLSAGRLTRAEGAAFVTAYLAYLVIART